MLCRHQVRRIQGEEIQQEAFILIILLIMYDNIVNYSILFLAAGQNIVEEILGKEGDHGMGSYSHVECSNSNP